VFESLRAHHKNQQVNLIGSVERPRRCSQPLANRQTLPRPRAPSQCGSSCTRLPRTPGTLGLGQDECWEVLSEGDRTHLHDSGHVCCSATEIAEWRARNQKLGTARLWQRLTDREDRRLLTAMSNREMRAEFCRLYNLEYPGDQDTGCPAHPARLLGLSGLY
jgi:hypothetical protein